MKKANELGLRSRNGGRMQMAQIHRMLHNQFYYGAFHWRGELYQGTHGPIIGKDVWNRVQ